MTARDDSPGNFERLARYSLWKIGGFSFFGLAMAIIPNLPGINEAVTYANFFYTGVGISIRVLACMIIGVLGLLHTVIFVLTVFGSRTAVWIENDELKWRVLTRKSFRLSELQSVTYNSGIITLGGGNGMRARTISTSLLRSKDAPEPLVSRLRKFADIAA